MPATLTVCNLGDLQAGKKLQALVFNHFRDIQGDWRVTLLGDQQKTAWELKVDAPDGTRLGVKKLYAEVEPNRLDALMGYIDLFTRDVPRV